MTPSRSSFQRNSRSFRKPAITRREFPCQAKAGAGARLRCAHQSFRRGVSPLGIAIMRRVGLRRKRIPTQLTDREATIMEYFEPKSISEALSVLVKHGAEAKVIAGGTDVMVDIKFKEEPGSPGKYQEAPRHERHQRERRQPAHRRRWRRSAISDQRSGARKTASALGSRHQFASLQMRNTATIGGNICRASPSGETLAPLLVLEATGKCAFSDGEKSRAVHVVLSGPGQDRSRRERSSD